MLPTTNHGSKRSASQRNLSLLSTYMRRFIRPKQMDFE